MKEIKTLLQQLRNYPDNFFVYPNGHIDFTSDQLVKTGLVVCNHLGEVQGFIETGSEKGVVIEA